MELPGVIRPPWWQRPWVFLVALFAGIVAIFWLGNKWEQATGSDPSEIFYGTIVSEASTAATSRHLGRQFHVRVRLENGKLTSAFYGKSDIRGCKVGSTVALQKRGASYVVAPIACPFAAPVGQ